MIARGIGRVAVLVVTAVALVCATRLARAEGAPVRLEYHAPAACPDAESVREAVRLRAPRVRVVDEQGAGSVLRLVVEPAVGSFRGTLEIRDANGSRMHRELSGPSCEGVVSALALVAALALDPMSDAGEAPPSTPSPGPLREGDHAPAGGAVGGGLVQMGDPEGRGEGKGGPDRGGSATVIAHDTSPTAIAVDANSVYWSDQAGYIKSVPK